MLDLNISRLRFDSSRMIGLHSSVARIEEGTVLQSVVEGGKEVVLAATGASGERIAGLALNNPTDFSVAPRYEEIMVPAAAPYTVTLANAPVAGSMRVAPVAGGTAYAADAGSGLATGEYTLAGRVLTFAAADAGVKLRVSYRYNPTLVELQALYGQQMFNNDPQGIIRATGVLYHADEIYLTNFDPASDWWAATPGPLYSGAGGIVTKSSGGKLLDDCWVIAAPSAVSPFLGLRWKV